MTNQAWPKEPWVFVPRKITWDLVNIEFDENNKPIKKPLFNIKRLGRLDHESFIAAIFRIYNCVNALAGIEDPDAFVKEAKRLMEEDNDSK